MQLIDRLEILSTESFSVPGLDKVLLDKIELLELVDQMRASIPEDVEHAQEVLASQEQLLQDARESGQRIREEAESAFRQRLDEHQLVAAARAEAEKVMARAEQQAQDTITRTEQEMAERRREFNEYVLLQLRRLENSLNTQLGTVNSAIQGVEEEEKLLGSR